MDLAVQEANAALTLVHARFATGRAGAEKYGLGEAVERSAVARLHRMVGGVDDLQPVLDACWHVTRSSPNPYRASISRDVIRANAPQHSDPFPLRRPSAGSTSRLWPENAAAHL